MAIYWMTEALPMAVTALLPIVMMPWLDVMGSKGLCANYLKVSISCHLILIYQCLCNYHVARNLANNLIRVLVGFTLPLLAQIDLSRV